MAPKHKGRMRSTQYRGLNNWRLHACRVPSDIYTAIRPKHCSTYSEPYIKHNVRSCTACAWSLHIVKRAYGYIVNPKTQVLHSKPSTLMLPSPQNFSEFSGFRVQGAKHDPETQVPTEHLESWQQETSQWTGSAKAGFGV